MLKTETVKTLLVTLLLCTIISCGPNNKDVSKTRVINEQAEAKDGNFVKQLIEKDFLKYAEKTVIILPVDSLDIYDPSTNKFAHIDAEELAEFNFDFFLPQLNKMLIKRDVNLSVKTTDDYERTNDIVINRERINLYSQEELKNESFWNTAPRNFFKKLNQILEEKGSDEKFYLVYEGNDLSTFLLTKSQYEIIRNHYQNEVGEIPYKP